MQRRRSWFTDARLQRESPERLYADAINTGDKEIKAGRFESAENSYLRAMGIANGQVSVEFRGRTGQVLPQLLRTVSTGQVHHGEMALVLRLKASRRDVTWVQRVDMADAKLADLYKARRRRG